MSSFIRRNGFGPSARWLIGMTAYQNRRMVFCCAVSIASALRPDGTVVAQTRQPRAAAEREGRAMRPSRDNNPAHKIEA